jgi:hypothetical protein
MQMNYFFFLGLTGFGLGAGFPATDTLITSSKLPSIASLVSYLSARFFFAFVIFTKLGSGAF